MGILGSLWAFFDEIRLHRMAEQTAAVEVYRRLRRFGKSLEVDMKLSDTPYEFTVFLIARLKELRYHNRKPEFASDLFYHLQTLTDAIVRTSYRPSQPDLPSDSSVLQQWKNLRWKLWWMWILNYGRKRIGLVSRIWGMRLKREKEFI